MKPLNPWVEMLIFAAFVILLISLFLSMSGCVVNRPPALNDEARHVRGTQVCALAYCRFEPYTREAPQPQGVVQ